MATQMLSRRTFMSRASAGTDQVFAGIWLPANTRVSSVSGFIDLEGTTPLASLTMCYGSVEGWVMPVVDVDGSQDMNTVFDTKVPKDTAGIIIDLDSESPFVSNFYEPGEIMWDNIFPIGQQPQRVFERKFQCSLGRNSVPQRDPATPFGYEYVPVKHMGLNLNRPIFVDEPSLLAFAVASPFTTTTQPAGYLQALVEEEWGQLQFIDHVLERAMLALLGVIEAGAESPWEEAITLLRKHLDPEVLETQGDAIVPVAWQFSGEMVIDHLVEGTMPKGAISGGR